MSQTIHNEAVNMEFNNASFERNAKQSMSTLEKLKNALDFSGAKNSLESLNNASKKVSFSDMVSSMDVVGNGFSKLEQIGVGALRRLGESIEENLVSKIKSVTFEPIETGFSKYEEKSKSIATIMNATGKSIDEVNTAVEKLTWYADETSYSLTDMVSNIGKFTSNGVDLETAVTAMEGISNWAAESGQGITQASMAMYNLSQAISAGAVKLIDWKSIQNANMATQEFKQTVLNTATALGTLTKEADGTYKTIDKGTTVTLNSFSETLSEGWFTSDVLLKTLEEYGGFADQVYEEVQKTGELTADVIDRLSASEETLGSKSLKAAQESKTFTDALEATKDAVSSGWMQTFELIFGDYEQAKTLWSSVAEDLYNIFAASAEKRNDVISQAMDEYTMTSDVWAEFTKTCSAAGVSVDYLEEAIKATARQTGTDIDSMIDKFGDFESTLSEGWLDGDTVDKAIENIALMGDNMSAFTDEELLNQGYTKEQIVMFRDLSDKAEAIGVSLQEVKDNYYKTSGRDLFYESIHNLLQVIVDLKEIGGEAWGEIFPANTADIIYNIVSKVHDFTEAIQLNGSKAEVLKTSLKGLFSIFSSAKHILGLVGDYISSNLNIDFGDLGSKIGNVITQFSNYLLKINEWVKESATIEDFLSRVKEKAYEILPWFQELDEKYHILEKIGSAFKTVKNAITELYNSISNNGNNGTSGINNLISKFNSLQTISLSDLSAAVSDIVGKIKEFVSAIGESLGLLQETKDVVVESSSAISGSVRAVGKALGTTSSSTKSMLDVLKDVGNYISKVFSKISLAKIIPVVYVLSVAKGISALTAALKSIRTPVKSFSSMCSDIGSSFKSISSYLTKGKSWSNQIKNVAISISLLAASMLVLSKIPKEDLWEIAGVLGVLALGLTAFGYVMGKFGTVQKGMETASVSFISLALGITALVGAMYLIKKLSLGITTDWSELVTLAGLLVTLAVAAALMKAAGKKSLAGSVGLLAFAGSLIILATAVEKIKSIGVDDVSETVEKLKPFFNRLIVIMAVSKLAGKYASSFGIAILGIVAAMGAFLILIKLIGKFTAHEISRGLTTIAGMAAIIAALIAVSSLAGQYSLRAGLSMIAISVAMTAMVGVMALINLLDDKAIIKGEAALAGMATMISLMLLCSKSAAGSAASIATVAVVITAISASLIALSFLDEAELKRSTIALDRVIGVVSMLILVSGLLAKNSDGFKGVKGTFIAIIAMIVVMGAALFVLANYCNAKALSSASKSLSLLTFTISGLVLAMGIVSKSEVDGKSILKASALAGVAVAVTAALAVILGAFTSLAHNQENAISSAAAISILLGAFSVAMIALAGASKIAGTSGLGTGSLVKLGAIAVVASALLTTILGVFLTNSENIDQAITGASAMAILITTFSVAMVALGAASLLFVGGSYGLTGLATMGLGMLVVTDVLSMILTTLIDNVGDMNQAIPAAVTLGILMNTFATAMAIMGVASMAFAAGAVGAPIMAEAIGALAIVIGAMGAIVTYFGNKDATIQMIKDGGEVVAAIAEAIGTVAGNLVGSFLDSSLTGAGEGLSNFLTSVSTGFSAFADIDPKAFENVLSLCGCIVVLAGAEFVSGLFNIADTLGLVDTDSFSSQFAKLGDALASFYESIKDRIPEDAQDYISRAVECCTGLAEIADLVPTTGGIIQDIIGGKDISGFGTGLTNLGTGLVDFAKSLIHLPTNATANSSIAKTVMKDVTDIADDIPNHGGLAGLIAGENDLEDFAPQMRKLAKGLFTYCRIIEQLPEDAPGKSALAKTIMDDVVSIADKIPNNGGWAGFFAGENDIDDFGSRLEKFGTSVAAFAGSLIGVDFGGISIANVIIGNLADTFQKIADVDLLAVDSFINEMGRLSTLFTESWTEGFTEVSTVTDSVDAISTFVSSLSSALTDDIETFKIEQQTTFVQAAEYMLEGFNIGLDNKKGEVYYKIYEIGTEMVKNLNKGLDEHSPSKATYKSGKNFAKGLENGISAGTKDVEKAASEMATKSRRAYTKSAAQRDDELVDGVARFFKGVEEKTVETASGIEESMTSGSVGEAVMGFVTDELGVDEETANTLKEWMSNVGTTSDESIADGLDDSSDVVTEATTTVVTTAAEEAEEVALKYSEETGHYYVEGIASGITSDTSAEDAASQKAQNIADAFQDSLDAVSTNISTYDSRYSLWEALNPNATDYQKYTKQVQIYTDETQEYYKQARLYYDKYLQYVAAGLDSQTINEALNTAMDYVTKYVDMGTKLSEAQSNLATAAESSGTTLEDTLASWYEADPTSGKSAMDYLVAAGFSEDDMVNAIKSDFESVGAAGTDELEYLAKMFGDTSGITMLDVGTELGTQMGTGISEGISSSSASETASNAMTTLITSAAESASSVDLTNCKTLGEKIMEAIIEGIEGMQESVETALVDAVSAAITAATAIAQNATAISDALLGSGLTSLSSASEDSSSGSGHHIAVVLDLDDFLNGGRYYTDDQGYVISSSASQAEDTATSMKNYGITSDSGDTTNNYNYVQNVYSTQPLSRKSLYMDSKSLLAIKKGVNG